MRRRAGTNSRACWSPPPGGRVPCESCWSRRASPTIARLLGELAERRPDVRVHFHEALPRTAPAAAATAVFGRPLELVAAPGRAARVLSLDADFVGAGPFHLRYAREIAERRRVRSHGDRMSRLYVVEPSPTPTGDVADHRIRRRARDVGALLAAVLSDIAQGQGAAPELIAALAPLAARERDPGLAAAIAADLREHRSESLVLAGSGQPVAAHAMAYAIGALLDAPGRTVSFVEPVRLGAADEAAELAALVDALNAGTVDKLVILGGNPVYHAPPALRFEEALQNAPLRVCLASHPNETSQRCQWRVPELHALESWGDARALDGTASVVQPLIDPLFEGRTRAELLALVGGVGPLSAHELVRSLWAGAGGDAEARFEEILATGVVPDSASTRIEASPDLAAVARLVDAHARATQPADDGAIEVVLRSDASVHDGRFANNPWLQELPDPITKVTWGNGAWLSPATARRLDVETGDWLALRRGEQRLEIPALVVPGQADESVALSLGYGRSDAQSVAGGVGVDVGVLRAVDPSEPLRATVSRVDDRARHEFARTQQHHRLHGREIVRERALDQLGDPEADGVARPLDALYESNLTSAPQWAMTIDLTVCSGCSACVIACQAENNIPVVGPEAVRRGREMQWLRVDRYHSGSESDPDVANQVMACQHCEMAPCEYVCPVGATVHSGDGLNEMVYNRCVGTRFCSNNCPYKVRRFNWFDWNADVAEPRKMQFNPDVTVRARGVMEKCTYCVQRIRRAEIRARNDGRPLADGEIVTACQQACPTQAIRFGSIADPESDVSRTRAAPHCYGVLAEQGTRPRTRYLARVRNRNARLEEPG